MKKLFTLLALTLLCVGGVKAADVVLFTTNFSKADGWTTESIITETTTSATRTIKGTTISFANWKNSDLTVAVNDNDASANGTLTFMGNNLSASNGTAKYYMAIPLSGVNKSITVEVTGDAMQYYAIKDGANSDVGDRVKVNSTQKFTIEDLENSDVILYLCTSKAKINSLTITTPSANTEWVLNVTEKTNVMLTKDNIENKGYLLTSTEDWKTESTYGDYTGIFYNMSKAERYITIKSAGAAAVEFFVQNSNSGRGYTVQAGNNPAISVSHGASGIESSGIILCPSEETTIKLAGNNGSVYPIYAVFYATVPTVSVTVPSDGFCTFTPSSPVSFAQSNIAAYKASISDGDITFTRIREVAAGEGVLLYAEGGATENIPVGNKSAADSDNAFVGTLTDIDALATNEATAAFTNYILNDGASGIGFYKANGQKVAAGKAYLRVDTSAGAKTFFGFDSLLGIDGVVTGINEVKSAANDNILYNQNGVRVAVPTQKGVYILNGKKYVVK